MIEQQQNWFRAPKFGTRGSEVQILSPRPFNPKQLIELALTPNLRFPQFGSSQQILYLLDSLFRPCWQRMQIDPPGDLRRRMPEE